MSGRLGIARHPLNGRSSTMKLVRLTVLAAALALFGVACGGGSSPSPSPTPPPPGASPSGGGPTPTTPTPTGQVFDPTIFTVPRSQSTLQHTGGQPPTISGQGAR